MMQPPESNRARRSPSQTLVAWRSEIEAFELSGYTIEKLLYSSRSAQLHCAVRDQDQQRVVLKRYTADVATLGVPRVQREFEVLRRFDAPVLSCALCIEHGQDQPVLVLDWFAGIPIEQFSADRELAPLEFCELALQITEALGIVHSARVLHRDIKPSNILIDPRTRRIQLIDFGLAVPFGSAMTPDDIRSGTRQSGGSLQFAPPEQTGRMDRGIDFRSDLYSLGATFYLMLTGRAPFVCRDMLELVHSLMARVPPAPIELRPDLPDTISRIVAKLLAKEPSDRYQRAEALHQDLRWCRDQLLEHGEISGLERLGSCDIPSRPIFGSALHGREHEAERLRSAFARVREGASELVLIHGAAGIGKSSMVAELREPVAASGGYLARGKYESLGLERPYAGISAAFEDLAHQLLAESDERVNLFAERIRTGLGSIAGVILDLAPSLAFILGEVDAIPALDAQASKARTALAVRRLVCACARPEHPFVIVLDDLQWADSGSLNLLDAILEEPPIEALLVVGTYRDAEVAATHALHAWIGHVESREPPLTDIGLCPLSDEAAAEMVAACLERSREDVAELSRQIRAKVGNHPLFIQQFIGQLHECGLLGYSPLTGGGVGWTWDAAKISMAEIPDDAVELVVGRISQLPQHTRDVLSVASCLGNAFDAALLATVVDRPRDVLEDALFQAADSGFVVPCRQGFRFAHDRLRQAIQDLLEPDERSRRHYEMAVLLSEIPGSDAPSDRVLEIAEHLSHGRRHIGPEFRARALDLFVAATRQALQLGAVETALSCIQAARDQFTEVDWSADPESAFELHLLLIEASYQGRDMEAALDWIEALDRRSLSEVEQARLAEKRIRVYCLTRAPEDTVRYTLLALSRLGIRWPFRPSRMHVSIAVLMAECALRGYGNPLSLLPESAKRRAPLASMLVRAAGGTMNLVDAQLVLLACSVAVCNTPTSELVAGYGGNKTFFFPSGRACHRAAARVEAQLEIDPDPSSRARAEFLLQALILCWIAPRRQTIPPLDRASESFLELGDLQFAQFARLCSVITRILVGDWVEPVERDMRELLREERNPGGPYMDIDLAHHAYRVLLGGDMGIDSIEAPVALCSPTGAPRPLGPMACVTRMLVFAVHGRFAAVFEESERIYADLFRRAPALHLVDHMFLRGLAAAVLIPRAPARQRRALLRSLHTALRWLRRWAKSGPDFQHMDQLLRAEDARIRGNARRAEKLYRAAAARAEQIGHRHHAGIAHERHADLLRSIRRHTNALSSLEEAIRCYRAWGAHSKVAELRQERAGST